MANNLNELLKEAAVYSNEIIKLAKAHDQRTFEYAKGARKYFAIYGESYADSFVTSIESYRLLELTYRKLSDYAEVIKIYKKIEEQIIPEAFGRLFKKMIEDLKKQSSNTSSSIKSNQTSSKPNTNYTSSPRVNSNSTARQYEPPKRDYGTARVYRNENQDRGTASVANPYLNGGRKY